MAVTDFFAGEIVTELLKQLLAISRKSCMCKSAAESLHASISQTLPIIQEIKLSGVELPEFRQSQLDRFSETLREGLELATAALRSKRWNLYKNLVLSRKMEKIARAVDQFFQGPLQAHTMADLHTLRFSYDERFDRLERSEHRIEEALRSLTIGSGHRIVAEEAAATMAEASEPVPAGVGMEFAVRKVRELVVGRDDLSVVGVCGIGGSGKTTLAKEITRDDDVKSYFKGRILFLTVSQSPNVDQLRATIWGFLMGNNGLTNPNYVVPQFNLAQPMGPSVRWLVVLDDVWSLADLERLAFKLPGCKTLVTSRTKFLTVVNEAHEMALLREHEALALFCLSAFGQKSVPPMANESLVKQIVNECKGLPLALKVIGASLRDESEMFWMSAKNRLARGETIGESHETHLLERMAISVNCLSEEVRECFLDLGAFPEDKKIPLDVLVNVWAELHDIDPVVAFSIVVELANKNLLTLVKDSRFGDTYCSYYDIAVTQHDVLRDLALHLSSREKVTKRTRLLMPRRESGPPKVWEKNSDQPFNARLVSIHTGEMNEMDWFQMDLPKAEVLILNFSSEDFFLPPFINSMPNLRALVIINHHAANATLRNFPEFSSLANLRSLWLEKVSPPRLSATSSPLVRLQKLSLFLCKVNGEDQSALLNLAPAFPSLSELTIDHCDDLFELPPSLCALPRLDTLSVTNCHNLHVLPPDLGRAESLRVLRLYACPELRDLPGSLVELWRLEYLDLSQCVRLSRLPLGIERMERLEKIDMRDCSRIDSLPRFAAPARSLRHVVCDEDAAWLWQDAKKALPNLYIQVADKDYSLDWLDE